ALQRGVVGDGELAQHVERALDVRESFAMCVALGCELHGHLEVLELFLDVAGGFEVGCEPRCDLAYASSVGLCEPRADARVKRAPLARRRVVTDRLMVDDVGELERL